MWRSRESDMITERQKAFRREYRSRIVGWYDGYVHILIIYAIGAAAFYIYVRHISNVTWLEWLTVPLTFLFTNIFEWAVHRFIMHRPVNIKGLRAIYERHTLNHHQFFTDEEMRFRDTKDWRVTVFPPNNFAGYQQRRTYYGEGHLPVICSLSRGFVNDRE